MIARIATLPRPSGIRVIPIEEFFARGADDVMAEARERAGSGDTYVSYDIDFVDPAYAPGTGTPEVGGPTSLAGVAGGARPARGEGGGRGSGRGVAALRCHRAARPFWACR